MRRDPDGNLLDAVAPVCFTNGPPSVTQRPLVNSEADRNELFGSRAR